MMQRLVKDAWKRHPGLNSGGADITVVGGESAASPVLEWVVKGTSVALSLDFSWWSFSLLVNGSAGRAMALYLLLYNLQCGISIVWSISGHRSEIIRKQFL